MLTTLRPARLGPPDVLRVGATGLRTRPLRAVLSALGIAIGIAAMVAVVGISSSSRAELDRTLTALGTNLLRVAPGTDLFGEAATLPSEAVDMVRRIAPVENATSVAQLDAKAYRSDLVPTGESGGIGVYAADLDLLESIGGTVADGAWLSEATARDPAVVLGHTTAKRLGITTPDPAVKVWIGGEWFTVVGILDPVPLAPEMDLGALVGREAAVTYLDWDVAYPAVMPIPMRTPAAPPMSESTNDSTRNWPRICPLVAPSERRRPISARRSRTEMTMVLATPIPPTSSATAPSPTSSPVNASSVACWAASASEGRETSTSLGACGLAVAPRTPRTCSTASSRVRV